MTDTPTDDMHGFVTEEPEHCDACHQPIRPEQTYYLIMGQAILCEGCLGTTDAIRVAGDLAVVIEGGQLVVRRGGAVVEVVRSAPPGGCAGGGGDEVGGRAIPREVGQS
jgi:hypothetical protein